MPRSTNATLDSLLQHCETQSTAKITLRDGTVYFLTTDPDALQLGGDDYVSGLLRVGELKETLGNPTNRVNVLCSNVDGALGLTVAAATRKTELAAVEVKRFYRSLSNPATFEWKHFFTGKAVSVIADEREVSFDVIDDIAAAGTCIATETLSPNNGWRFPETPDQSPPGTDTNPDTGIGTGHCFLAGTLIRTPKGEQPIESFKEGMAVYSFDELSRAIETDRVSKVFRHIADCWYELTFSDGSRVSVTSEHPFLTDSGEWVRAGDLIMGRAARRFDGRKWTRARLERVHFHGSPAEVWNIEVERNHNYFANGFAVHNKIDPNVTLE